MKEEKIAAVILTMRRGFWKGVSGLWFLSCLYRLGKQERELLEVTKLLLASRSETQMSAPVAAPEPCLVEGYVVGEENGKIIFWKAGLSL